MNMSHPADTRILSVSIVAGPSASALLEQIGAMKRERWLILPASATSSQEGGDYAVKQIKTIAEQGGVDHLIIECTSETPMMAYASLFLSPHLTAIARLSTTVLAIRPSDLVDSLIRRIAPLHSAAPCFVSEQLELVDSIVLDRGEDDPDSKMARLAASALNPRAQVCDLSPETVDKLFGNVETTSFDFAAALDGAGWRRLIDADTPYQADDGIVGFAYRARRPFHAERFWHLLQTKLPGVFRAKGFFWLATRMDLVGGLNLAGSELHCAAAGQWWAAQDDHARQHEMPERTRKEWQEPFGDRRQAIAFVGIDFDPGGLKTQLDACLLTDSEMSAGEEAWQTLADPFPSWSVHSHTHDCDHDHESGDHECCHH
jgi:G3E family GTPase